MRFPTVLLMIFLNLCAGFTQNVFRSLIKKPTNYNKITCRQNPLICRTSDECPIDKYCCEIVKGVVHICCGDPMSSVENLNQNGLFPIPIPVPVQREYDY